jgi:formamidopyrimidine-DNA glycosylase
MVEGHSVHRVAVRLRNFFLKKILIARSPNGRFADGAKDINRRVLTSVEAVGKNLFLFFDKEIAVHIHFGMAGLFPVYNRTEEQIPEPSKTNRLRLETEDGLLVADLSAMTCKHGPLELYEKKKQELGQDPLRDDADPDLLWLKVSKSKKSIGLLIMDQSFFTGPGNIYRAEILFKAGIHPETPGNSLTRQEFDTIWFHTVELLQWGYEKGSILTVLPEEANALGRPWLRRYIYNSSSCGRCGSKVVSWSIANRTCYRCVNCQPMNKRIDLTDRKTTDLTYNKSTGQGKKTEIGVQPFISHCASEPLSTRIRIGQSDMQILKVKELRKILLENGFDAPRGWKKSQLGDEILRRSVFKSSTPLSSKSASLVPSSMPKAKLVITSGEDAAMEKVIAGESRSVEHTAELSMVQVKRLASQARERNHTDVITIQTPSRKRKMHPLSQISPLPAPAPAPAPVLRDTIVIESAIKSTRKRRNKMKNE